jgi:hypothetical protein
MELAGLEQTGDLLIAITPRRHSLGGFGETRPKRGPRILQAFGHALQVRDGDPRIRLVPVLGLKAEEDVEAQVLMGVDKKFGWVPILRWHGVRIWLLRREGYRSFAGKRERQSGEHERECPKPGASEAHPARAKTALLVHGAYRGCWPALHDVDDREARVDVEAGGGEECRADIPGEE